MELKLVIDEDYIKTQTFINLANYFNMYQLILKPNANYYGSLLIFQHFRQMIGVNLQVYMVIIRINQKINKALIILIITIIIVKILVLVNFSQGSNIKDTSYKNLLDYSKYYQMVVVYQEVIYINFRLDQFNNVKLFIYYEEVKICLFIIFILLVNFLKIKFYVLILLYQQIQFFFQVFYYFTKVTLIH